MYRYGPGGFHHPVFAALLLALLAAAAVLGVILVMRMWRNPHSRSMAFQRGTPPGPSIDPALGELRVRYARGDITWDEFAQRAGNLGYPLPPVTGSGPDSTGSPPESQVPPGAGT